MPQIPYSTTLGVKYANITTTSPTTVKTGPGYLEGIVVNTPAAGTVTVADNGTTLGILTLTATYPSPGGVTFGVNFVTNLTITASVAMDLTVLYR